VNYKAGQETTDAGGTAVVEFGTAFTGPYSVSLTVVDRSGQVIVWATAKGGGGFTINAAIPGGAAVVDAQVDWIAISSNDPA
jgi:hypothetical protein